jgi:hypothetical protein
MPPRTNDSPRFHRTEVLYVRIDKDIVDLLRKLAEHNERSIASTTAIVLKKGLGLPNIQPLFEFLDDV